ncbi:hypothetical protein BAE40_21785 [Mesorhizobium loti]|nr:hypothetical protein BAE41_20725 [Mesorhizobium loti]OBP89117.1 hypothetical protein BAE40_21785 [Mesorhizobium loti]
MSGFTMLLCSASAAARKHSISARDYCLEGLVLAIGDLRFEGFAATRNIFLHMGASRKRNKQGIHTFGVWI